MNNLMVLTGASLLLMAGAAKASLSETFTATHSPSTTDWSDNFVLQQFDPSLGTLQSVMVTATENVTMSGTIHNYATVSESFSFSAGSLLTVTLPGSLGVIQASPMSHAQVFNLPSGANATFGPTTATDTGSSTYTLAGDMAWFLGTGTFSLPGQTVSSELITGGGGNLTALLNTVAGATVQVQYTYATVPEPGTFVSGALIAAAMLLRWRR